MKKHPVSPSPTPETSIPTAHFYTTRELQLLNAYNYNNQNTIYLVLNKTNKKNGRRATNKETKRHARSPTLTPEFRGDGETFNRATSYFPCRPQIASPTRLTTPLRRIPTTQRGLGGGVQGMYTYTRVSETRPYKNPTQKRRNLTLASTGGSRMGLGNTNILELYTTPPANPGGVTRWPTKESNKCTHKRIPAHHPRLLLSYSHSNEDCVLQLLMLLVLPVLLVLLARFIWSVSAALDSTWSMVFGLTNMPFCVWLTNGPRRPPPPP